MENFLTFKDVKFDSWKATLDKIRSLLQAEFGRHQEILDSIRFAKYEKEFFVRIMDGSATEVDLMSALDNFSKMLAENYEKAPVIIIDEYDTPIQEGYAKDFYDEIIGFMRNFFSGAFKDNKNLSYGFLIYANDLKKLQQAIAEYMNKSISFYDSGAEGFYHGLILGLLALMDNQYKIKSNRESGNGRYDISLIPRSGKHPGIIMELLFPKRM